MRFKIQALILSLPAALFMGGCYEDKGNYEYAEVEEVTITMPEKIEAMAYAENIQFTPTIVSSLTGKEISADDPGYEYECKLWYTHTEDGITQNLYDINPDKTQSVDFYAPIPAGNYGMWYIVRNKKTGVETNAKGTVTLISSTSEGWMVLSNNGSEKKIRLDMIFTNSKGEELVAKDVTGSAVTDLTEGTQIMINPSMFVGKEAINLLTRSGSYRLDVGNLVIRAANNLKLLDFILPTTPGDAVAILPIHYYSSYGPTSTVCVTSAGNAYAITSGSAGASFEFPMNTDEVGNDPTYQVAQMLGTSMARPGNSSSALFYDVTNKRFMGWSYYAQNKKLLFPLDDNGEGQPQGLFSFNTGMDIVDMESTRFSDGLVYSVLQDNAGHRHVYGINMSGYNQIVKESAYDNISAEDFDTATDYAFHSQFPYMFYCKNNKVYAYGLGDGSMKDVLTLAAGERVTKLKFNLYQNMQLSFLNKWSDPDFQNMQYRLIVCSTTGGEDSGIVRIYDVSTTGKMTLYREYTGLGEEIVDITYRECRG